VCLSVCEDIFETTLANCMCMLLMAVARTSSSTVTKSQEEGQFLRVFFPIDSALYSIAFETHNNG